MMPFYEHENFGDVQDHVFMKGKITSVDSDNDLADVTVPGGEDGIEVPLFYHCFDESEKRENGAIAGASEAFYAGDDVIVMCTVGGTPVRVVGFTDGLKACDKQAYIVIGAAKGPWGGWYILWDCVAGVSLDSVEWKDNDGKSVTINFPYHADWTFSEFMGLTSVVTHGALTPEQLAADPFYDWLKNRRWEPGIPEDMKEGCLPAIRTNPGLHIIPQEFNTPQFPVITPNVSAHCTPPKNGSCSFYDSGSNLCRFDLGLDLGLENTGTLSGKASQRMGDGPPRFLYNTYSSNLRELYPGVPTARELRPEWTNSIEMTGPFLSAVITRPDESEDVIGSILQALYKTTGYSSDDECIMSYEVHISKGFIFTSCDASADTRLSNSYSFTFDTPIGKLDGIKFSGAMSYVRNGVGGGVGGGFYSLWEAPCCRLVGDYSETFRLPTWNPIERADIKKNLYQCEYSNNVIYQIYYYSATAHWYNRSASNISSLIHIDSYYDSSRTSRPYTSVRAAVEYREDGVTVVGGVEPEDGGAVIDPLNMEKHTGFEEAINSLLEVAGAEEEVIYSLIAKVFN